LARLQTFPDDFIFTGSKTNILIQIGNAVPCILGEHIGIVVKQMLHL
jgi:site-specific DNA-cytosine methylase